MLLENQIILCKNENWKCQMLQKLNKNYDLFLSVIHFDKNISKILFNDSLSMSIFHQ